VKSVMRALTLKARTDKARHIANSGRYLRILSFRQRSGVGWITRKLIAMDQRPRDQAARELYSLAITAPNGHLRCETPPDRPATSLASNALFCKGTPEFAYWSDDLS